MKSLTLLCCFLLVLAVMLAGCGASSDQTAAANQNTTPAVTPPKRTVGVPVPVPDAQTDTVNVAVQKAQKPPYETTDPVKTTLPPSALVKYCVQVGAYKLQDNADVVASLAKSRFAKNVYTILDATTSLYKVMVGDFTAKDDARMFRDRMVQQYPGDYKDAWVSELSH